MPDQFWRAASQTKALFDVLRLPLLGSVLYLAIARWALWRAASA